jgi:hypothetical protein
MSQNDFVLADAPGASFRSDVNSALQALATLSSGATAPSTTYALMEWLDTTTNTRKQRNAANSAWIVRGTIDETMVLSRSSNTIFDISDRNKTLIATGSYTQTFDAAATLGDGWEIDVIVDSGATLTLDPNGSETIDGATTRAIVGPAQGRVVCNGTLFRTSGFSSATITLGTQQNTTSGTSIDFTGIPSSVNRITAMFNGISTNGTSNYQLQIGSGSVVTTGYTSYCANVDGTNATSIATSTSAYLLKVGGISAASVGSGVAVLTRINGNTWVCSSSFNLGTAINSVQNGVLALGGAIDRLRLTTAGGTDTFDAGTMNISWE